MSETWAEIFAWLRGLAPSAGEIAVYDDWPTRDRVVVLHDATEEERVHVEQSLGLREPRISWRLIAPPADSTVLSPPDSAER